MIDARSIASLGLVALALAWIGTLPLAPVAVAAPEPMPLAVVGAGLLAVSLLRRRHPRCSGRR